MKNQLYLFVYGTLRQNCQSQAHARYLSDAKFIGAAKVRGLLYRVSFYPAFVECETDDWVTGEVYELPSSAALTALDVYEECDSTNLEPHEYQRRQVKAHLDLGDQIDVWCYVYQKDTSSLEPIKSGDFLHLSEDTPP